MTTQETLLTLIRLHILEKRNTEIYLNEEHWEDLRNLAYVQGVVGIAYDVISNLDNSDIPDHLKELWEKGYDVIKKRNQMISKVVAKQNQTWSKHGLHPTLIKGLEAAKFYPNPEIRQIGDIDWMVSPEEWDKALDVVHSNGLVINFNTIGDAEYYLKGIQIEHHKGFPESEPVECVIHILNHMCTTGIGLRHLCDFMMMRSELDWYRIDSLGLSEWTYLLCNVSDFILYGGEMTGEVRRFMNLIWMDGNFGFNKRRRWSGFTKRLFLLKYAPKWILKRWTRLLTCKIKQIWTN